MITSTRNGLIKRIRSLRQKKYRQAEGAFFVEGVRAVLTALEQHAPVEMLVWAPERLKSEVARAAIADAIARGVAVQAVSATVFDAISERDSAVGLGAVIAQTSQTLDDLTVTDRSVFVALFDISDPGNLGTIVRTADGAGAAGVILVGHTVDAAHPTAAKASMGALFAVPVVSCDSADALLAWAQQHGLCTVATSAHAPHHYATAPYRVPLLLLMGNEGDGLPQAVVDSAEIAVSIPMRGVSSSLNLAVATGLLLYQLCDRFAEQA